jgi:hypothetical protein
MTTGPDALDLLADGALGIEAAVDFTGLSRAELYRRMGRGSLPYVLQGRRRLLPRRALQEMLAEACAVASPPEAVA